MIKPKLIALTITLTVFTVAVQAQGGWGVITQDTETQNDQLEKNYTLELINTGENLVVLQFSATESPNYNITFQNQTYELEPSEITEDPQGSGWFYRGGEYVNLQETSFQIEVDEQRNTNNIDFNITAQKISEEQTPSQEISETHIVDQRDFNYELEIDQFLVREIDQNQQRETNEENETEIEENSQEEEVEESSEQTQDSENNIEEDQETFNTITLMLITAISALVVYLWV